MFGGRSVFAVLALSLVEVSTEVQRGGNKETNLVGGVTRQRADGALDSACGLVQVGLRSRGMVLV